MKILFAAALIAAVGFAKKPAVKSLNGQWTTGGTSSGSGLELITATSKWGFLSASYDFDFGYNMEKSLEQGEATEGVMDMWTQASLYSSGKLFLDVNILGLHELSVRINTTPFQFVPLWASVYYTHPAAVSKGIIDAYGAAIEFGWEYVLGNVQVEYYMNDLVPSVSIMDYISGTTDFIVPDFPTINAVTNNGGVTGWGDSASQFQYTADPVLSWSLFDQLNTDGSMMNQGSFAFIPLVNDNIVSLQ
jgi:hypothetical protein